MRRFSRQQVQGAPGHQPHEADREDQGRRTSSPRRASTRGSASITTTRKSCTAWRCEVENLALRLRARACRCSTTSSSRIEAGDRVADHRRERRRQDHAAAPADGRTASRDGGTVKWAEKARPGYFAQDHAADFAEDKPLTDWISAWVRAGGYEGGDVETLVRGTLGRLLFSGDEVKKSVQGDLRRRAGPHAVRQADAAAAQRAADGRADQPPRHGIHRSRSTPRWTSSPAR